MFIVKTNLIVLFFLFALAITSCGGDNGPRIQIENPWVRAALKMEMLVESSESTSNENTMGNHTGGSNSAAYMTISNRGSLPDRLVSAESEIAEAVEIHISEMVDEVMTMHQVEGVDLPASGNVELKPGGLHLMLIGLKEDLNAGEHVTIKLGFEEFGEIMIDAEVRAP